MIDSSMLPDFIIEATEHLEELEESLLRLEQHKEDKDVLNDIFRSMHTIKGAAQFVGIDRVSELSHRLENLLDLVRQGERDLNEELVDLLIEGKDRITQLVSELEQDQEEKTEITDLLQTITQIVEGAAAQEPDAEGVAHTEEVVTAATDTFETGDVAQGPGLEEDAGDEEYDEELYNIFMEQLKENIPFLQTQADRFASSGDKAKVLQRCLDVLQGLKSSANYMGYDKLTNHYTTWIDAVEEALSALESGQEPTLGMQPFIDEIVRVYPQSMADAPDTSEQEEMESTLDTLFSDLEETPPGKPEGKEAAPAEEGHQDLESALESLFDDTDQHPASTAPEEETAPDSDARQELEAALDGAFSGPLAPMAEEEQQITQPTPLKNEAAGEEYDEELLAIFIQQLRENIPFLQQQVQGLSEAADKTEVFKRCSSAIKTLKSSANYMGYEGLVHHYQAWQRAINTAVEILSTGGAGPDLDMGFMQSFIDEVVRAYPQAMEDQSADVGPGTEDGALPSPEDQLADAKERSAAMPETEEEPPADNASPARAENFAPQKGLDHAPESLVDETSDDEYDEELLSIFMQQLKENIPRLQAQIKELAGASDKQDVLRRCSDTVAVLKSSANYMGYEQLSLHYSKWQLAIADAQKELLAGQSPELGFMEDFLDEIIKVYPQAAAAETKAAPSEPVDEFEDVTETIDALLSDISPAPAPVEKGEPAAEAPPTAADAASVSTGEPVKEPASSPATEKEQELFARLSVALDASLEQTENEPLKPMHDVIGEMMTPAEEETGSMVTAEKQPPTLSDPDSQGGGTEAQTKDSTPPHGEESGAPVGQPQAEAADEGQGEQLPNEQEEEKAQVAAKNALPKKVKQSMRVDTDKIDFLMNEVGELVVSRAYFAQLFNEMKGLQQLLMEDFGLTKNELKPLNEFAFRLGEAGVALGRVSNELQEGVMKVRMLPIDQLFKRFPRLVRDLVHKSDKEVTLETMGEETELDKMVIEEISDPLIHILRNAVDHGIEPASERKRLGKPESGLITLEAYHESDHIVIDVTDDGRGLDDERVKTKALAMGLYSKEELNRMSSLELKHLIMQPGFSTADKATKTSGRGVGMDVVRKNIEKLNGSIEIGTEVGKGTRIRIKIPLTMAIIQALMVRVGTEKFTIPLTAVEETLRIFQGEISEIEGIDVIHLRDSTMPILRLSELFNIACKVKDEEKNFVVVVSTGLQELGLVVDELLGQEEVVIKPLADYLQLGSGFSGATILGDGGISLILDIPELVNMTTRNQISKQQQLSGRRRILDAAARELQAEPLQ